MTPLEKSIEHWRENVAATRPSQASVRGSDCQLCLTYFLKYGACKSGCPVALTTGQDDCNGSPWGIAESALSHWEVNPNSSPAHSEFTRAAQDELDFLISLLPEKDSNA